MRKVNHKGFTLIELVVTIAIIAIFTGVITMLISNGSASYRSTSGNARVQMETQETLNQIQDLVIDTNRTMYYGAGENLNDLPLITNDIDGGGLDDNTVKTFVVCSASDASSGQKDKEDYVWDVLTWKSADKKIYYNRYEKKDQIKYEEPIVTPTPEGTGSSTANKTLTAEDSPSAVSGVQNNVATPAPNPTVTMENADHLIEQSVFAEDITGFWADIREVETKRVVRFQIQADKRGKNIKTLHTVNLRNKVKIEKPGNISALPSVDASIKITNIPKELADDCGGYLFEKVTFGEIMAGSVQWSVAGDNGQNIPGWEFPDSAHGKLIIKTPESYSGEYITVTVKATSINGKEIADSCKVKIIRKAIPIKLIPDKESIILGVVNTYNLNEVVKFRVEYSDGSEKKLEELGINVSWEGSIGENKIQETGEITEISKNLGVQTDNSNFSATATCTVKEGKKEIKLQIEIPIKIARVDLKKPNGTYHVGVKKELEYVYKEGGIEIPDVTYSEMKVISTDSNSPEKTINYSHDEEFFESEVGKWEATIKVPVRGSEKTVSSSSLFEVKDVKKSTLKAEIKEMNNRTSLLPGDQAELYLVLTDVNTGEIVTQAVVDWKNLEKKTIAGKAGKVIFSADEKHTSVKITAQYTLDQSIYDKYENPEGEASITLVVSKLLMTLTTDRTELRNNNSNDAEKMANLNVTIHDVENNKDVTETYTITWNIDKINDTLYKIISDTTNAAKAKFKLLSDINEVTKVVVTATAQRNGVSLSQTCELTIYPLTIYKKTYYLVENNVQKLEHPEVISSQPQSYESYYIDLNNAFQKLESIEQLVNILTSEDGDWNVTLKNRKEWDKYECVVMVVDYQVAKYYYYLYPADYNVYDWEYDKWSITGKFVKKNIFVPGTTDMILNPDICTLQDDGYTYTYGNYKLRYSINRMTGWQILGGWINSSAGKWFLKYNDTYYRYDINEQRWEEWSGINHIFAGEINEHWNTLSYWQKWN